MSYKDPHTLHGQWVAKILHDSPGRKCVCRENTSERDRWKLICNELLHVCPWAVVKEYHWGIHWRPDVQQIEWFGSSICPSLQGSRSNLKSESQELSLMYCIVKMVSSGPSAMTSGEVVLPVELVDEEGLVVTPAFTVEVLFRTEGLWSVEGRGMVWWAQSRSAAQGSKSRVGP